MIGILGGSGFESFEGFEILEKFEIQTPFGKHSSGLKKVSVQGVEALFLSRHGESHELLPSEINYPANIYALKKLGAKALISISAVGSLQRELPPGHLVFPLQYMDRTKGIRKHTFSGQGMVSHISLAHPVCREAAEKAFGVAKRLKIESHLGGTYICIEGPNFSTYAESQSYRALDCQIIGMTNVPEVGLAREAGLSYLPLSFVTDYDCWDTSRPHVTLAEVKSVMKGNNEKAFRLVSELVKMKDLFQGCDCSKSGLASGLMTSIESLSDEQREWLKVLS